MRAAQTPSAHIARQGSSETMKVVTPRAASELQPKNKPAPSAATASSMSVVLGRTLPPSVKTICTLHLLFGLTDATENRKALQQPVTQRAQLARHHRDAHRDHDRARSHHKRLAGSAQQAQAARCFMQEGGGKQERNAEPG